jgi:hypothetical protein
MPPLPSPFGHLKNHQKKEFLSLKQQKNLREFLENSGKILLKIPVKICRKVWKFRKFLITCLLKNRLL